MRRRVAILALAGLLAGCGAPGGGRSQADQDRDGRTLAAAIQGADRQGVGFDMDESLVLSGGDVPAGKAVRIHATVQGGSLRGGNARLVYRIEQGRKHLEYDMVLADSSLYVRPHGGGGWKVAPLAASTALLPALRLALIRESVLLASDVGGYSLGHVKAGFAHQFKVRPAADQLEQLESVPLTGSAETSFLKTARGELDVFLAVPGDKLGRVEVHLTGIDPGNGTRQTIANSVDFHPTRIGPIEAPAGATPAGPGEIFT